MKLNKNQRAFFENAIKHFDESLRAKNVKYGDLKAFAQTNGLILPTSFLKNHCKTGEHGWYNLHLSGVIPENADLEWHDKEIMGEDTPDVEVIEVNDSDNSVIIEKSSLTNDDVNPVDLTSKTDMRFKINRTFVNPIYVLTDWEGHVCHVCDSPVTAHGKIHNMLHSGHSMTKEQVLKTIKDYGIAVVRSTNSRLLAKITVYDMND